MKLSLFIILACAATLFLFAVSRPSIWGPFFYPLQYREIIKENSIKNNLDPNFVAAVIFEESKFYAGQKSRAGAIGLMQLLPTTAESIARDIGENDYGHEHLFDPERNIRYGTYYLRYLLDRFGEEELALAAYNAGETNVNRWLKEGRSEIPFEETKKFVQRVKGSRNMYEAIYGKWYDPSGQKESQ